MRFPDLAELREQWMFFCEQERISPAIILHPIRVIDILRRHRFLHFIMVGGSGAVLGIGLTWFLTTFFLGLERYFTAYIIGTCAALVFNFTLYSLVIFETEYNHVHRSLVYFGYILGVIVLQAALVRTLTPLFGLRWYLLIIACVIGGFALINFLVFKAAIFRE